MEAVRRVPRYYEVSQGIPKSIFKTHVTVAIILYYTFIITALKIKNLMYDWIKVGGFVRDQAGKGGRHRFCISNFSIQISEFTFHIC